MRNCDIRERWGISGLLVLEVVVALAAAIEVVELVELLALFAAASAAVTAAAVFACAVCFVCTACACATWWAADRSRRSSSDSMKEPEDAGLLLCTMGRGGP